MFLCYFNAGSKWVLNKYLLIFFLNSDCQFRGIVVLTTSCFWLTRLQQAKPQAVVFPYISGFNPMTIP